MTWSSSAAEVNGVKVLAAKLDGADAKTLRETMDQLKNKLKSGVIVLAVDRWRKGQPGCRRNDRSDREVQGG